MKEKTLYICSQCGNQSTKWEGKCANCQSWNSYEETTIQRETTAADKKKKWKESRKVKSGAQAIKDIQYSQTLRLNVKDAELQRTLGGGIVPGSITLVGGEPGIGKSTLLLQLAINADYKILYVSGEESAEQIKMRAQRIGIHNENCHILTETDLNLIFEATRKLNPELIIIDSIQTIASPYVDSIPGSISQVRECTSELQQFAKESSVPVFLIGHINKDGHIAGPKILEHIVDTVLQFEGDRNHIYRILRTKKNRFGSTDELGIYAMDADGLREVKNPSELLLSQSDENLSGSTVAVTVEGLRPMLIETQALVSQAIYGTPQRSATGFDLRRLSMLLAVLEKRAGLFFGQNDVFLNIAGGIKVQDTAIDLSIVAALISSLHNIPVSKDICFAAEVGLTGEVRAVNRVEQRIEEAAKLGFKEIYISKYNLKGLKQKAFDVELKALAKVDELMAELFT
jgi:DNA repair protein RadA/Sms